MCLEWRIDSNNAAQFEKEIMDAIAQAPGASLVLDAENLQYISSAGLRVLMKLRKQSKKALPVLNVSPEVYEIFEVTGFTELFDVRKALRVVSIEGCELIGSGANGQVYRLTKDEMIKVFRAGMTLEEIEAEREACRYEGSAQHDHQDGLERLEGRDEPEHPLSAPRLDAHQRGQRKGSAGAL